ncbi:MAG: amino acid ABC transporter substrate-binding protein [Chloroflexi bacterium]|nr:amino acid ABC transporter substrate-binding protein [Chloroflexota bacterium]
MFIQYLRTAGKMFSLFVIAAMALTTLGACAQSPAPSDTTQNQKPIKIGISVSLSGDFSDDGKALEKGYQLWAADVNKKGGLLGRPVQLDILSDNSNEQQVQTNYQKLITVDHVDLVFGPYSSLLTKPASLVANRFGYAFVEGAGTGPSVYTRGLHNLFSVSLSAVQLLKTTALYILSLPEQIRPKTAAYATEDDPFAGPQVDFARQQLEAGGVRTVQNIVYPAETTDYTPIAQKIIASGAQVDVLGTFLPDSTAFVQAFHQQHYNPQLIVATAGPDQAAEFSKAVGVKDTEGIFVPNTWWPGLNAQQNAQMVSEYVGKYGGTADQVSSDVAQAYSVGQVVEQAVNKIHSLDNKALINELHQDQFATVQGAVKFDDTGQNTVGLAYLFQWQHGQLVPVFPSSVATATPEFPKPMWS